MEDNITKRLLIKLTSGKFITGVILMALLTVLLVTNHIKPDQYMDGIRMIILGFFSANTVQKFSKR